MIVAEEKAVVMADYSQSKILDWWYDIEFNEYYALLETVEHELRLIITPKKEEDK